METFAVVSESAMGVTRTGDQTAEAVAARIAWARERQRSSALKSESAQPDVLARIRAAERSIRRFQGTLYAVRPKPGHDGGTPKTVRERLQVQYMTTHVFKNARGERDDWLDMEYARR